MTVINPNSISGITSITLPSGDSNVLTVHTNDGVERFRIDSSGNVKVGSAATISPDGDLFVTGVCTATTLAGSGANLTNLPAANVTGTLPAISGANLTSLTAGNLTGALPAISGANLTGIAATDNVRTGILDVAGIATFRSDVNIPNINGGQIGGRRNIIINGAMLVAQRGTSSSASSSEYLTLDRFRLTSNGTDEAPSQEQASVASGTSPYAEGFRKSFKITNGNQTSGAGAADFIRLGHAIEAQDIANSGWNYTSSSSFITCQFWIKSSVAQSFKVEFYSDDGTAQVYSIDTGSLSADTWTKVTKTIPGNSNLTFNNDANEGLHIRFLPFFGTDYTNNSVTEDAWAAYSSSTRTKDNTSTWYTTNNATFEITGVQLEVGSQATPFEHRSYGEELKLCQRYFETIEYEGYVFHGYQPSASSCEFFIHWNTEKRANPTVTLPTIGTSGGQINPTNYQGSNLSGGSLGVFTIKKVCARVTGGSWSNGTAAAPCALYSGGQSAYIYISAEL